MQGVICSGLGYYLSGIIMKAKGPVFVTAFNPLSMVIVAILGSFVLSEQLNLGRYIIINHNRSTKFHLCIYINNLIR